MILELGAEPPHTHVLGQLVDVLERLGADVEPTAALPLKALSRMRSSSRYPIDDTPPAELFECADSDQAIGTAEAVRTWLEGLDQPRRCRPTHSERRSPRIT